MVKLSLIALLFFSVSLKVKATEFEFQDAKASGRGCPIGTTSIVPSPDNQTLSFLFTEFDVEVPQFDGENENNISSELTIGSILNNSYENLDQKVCNLSFKTKIPKKKFVKSITVSLDYRGFTYSEQGTHTAFNSELVSKDGLGFSGKFSIDKIASKVWLGTNKDNSQEWQVKTSKEIEINSDCSDSTFGKGTLHLNLRNLLAARRGPIGVQKNASATLVLDSADVGGKLHVKLNLANCGENSPIGNNQQNPKLPTNPRTGGVKPEPHNPGTTTCQMRHPKLGCLKK